MSTKHVMSNDTFTCAACNAKVPVDEVVFLPCPDCLDCGTELGCCPGCKSGMERRLREQGRLE